jgi:signal transduction histidine kinase
VTVSDLRALIDERERAEQRLRVLSEASSQLTGGQGGNAAIVDVARLTLSNMADACAIALFDASGAVAWAAREGALFCPVDSSGPEVSLDELIEAARHGPRVLSAGEGYTSALAVPLVARGQAIGAIAMVRASARTTYVSEDLAWAVDLAQRIALAVDNATLHAALAERGQQLEELVARLFSAQEEERRHVAIDVHDGVAQTAAATHQRLESLAAVYRPRTAQTRRDLQRARELARRTVQEARRIIAGLRPTVLDDFGLTAALQQLAEHLRSDGWEVTSDIRLGTQRLAPVVETAFYRVAQEAVANVRKHAGADRVHLALEHDGRTLRLSIADNGGGFDPRGVGEHGLPGERVGVAGMQERLALLGGRLLIDSRRGSGTRVVAEIAVAASLQTCQVAGREAVDASRSLSISL